MKKVIIAENIMQQIGGQDTIFGRGDIVAYTARTSEEIVNIQGVRKADLIISDSGLPLMGGVKLCSALRSDPNLKQVSIIMACTDADASACTRAGANSVVRKPIDPVELFSKISELLVIPQRKNLRVLLRVSVPAAPENTTFFASSQNISISGMLLETDRVLKRDDQLICALNIGHSEISLHAVIARVYRTKSGRLWYGVRFLNPDTRTLVVIEQFVKSCVMH